MEENHASAALESIANGDHHDFEDYNSHATNNNSDHGWQKVTYQKRQRKNKAADSVNSHNRLVPGAVISASGDSVFRGVEKEAEERVRRRQEAKRAAEVANAGAIGVVPARSRHRSDDEYGDDSDDEAAPQNAKPEEEKKSKPKKPKKPKVTVAEAAAKIDVNDLMAELMELPVSFACSDLMFIF